ncbi:MAG: methionyl-tRNA formyltransferase [Clostridia bacterium]|nr:methionyl-tRNA formyltransferase [Clostridia bacterium]
MKILFMGTPDFAAVTLKTLCERGYDVGGVVSQPDKPKGRGMNIEPTPVKKVAMEYNIPTFQPDSLKNGELQPFLEEVNPDLIIVVAYGKILPEYVLNYPKYGCINGHASILPEYRGAAPIQRCIIDGKTQTGVTAMYMEKGLDTGNIILVDKIKIEDDDTAETLHDKLAAVGAEVLIKTVERFKKGDFSSIKQDDEKATYAHMLTKAEGEINWEKDSCEVYNLIRGMDSWPMAYTYYMGKRFVPYECKKVDAKGKCGEIVSVGKDGIIVACKTGGIMISAVKFDGKKKMSVKDYLVGNKLDVGVILGKSE